MAGTREGALKGVQTTKIKHGSDFYAKIGGKGGRNGNTGGFTDRDLASRAGRLGGLKSRRGKKKDD